MAKKRTTRKKSPAKKKPAAAKRSRAKRSSDNASAVPEARMLEEIAAGAGPAALDPFDQRFRIELAQAVDLEFFREHYGFTDSTADRDQAWRQLD